MDETLSVKSEEDSDEESEISVDVHRSEVTQENIINFC